MTNSTMTAAKMSKYKLAVWDLETDPFRKDIKPEPFLAGLFDGAQFVQFWGDDCIVQFVAWLRDQRPMQLYAHNGGKFDVFYLPWPVDSPKIIAGRIAQCTLGKHQLRDSYCILPFSLATYQKTKIDYTKFLRENREDCKTEIMQYHRDDLLFTYELIYGFKERFGNKLTIASAAVTELNDVHPIARKGENHDAIFRKYLFGGRVECFEKGKLFGNWKIYDVNSMYPYVMREFNHPVGLEYIYSDEIEDLEQFPDAPGFISGRFISAGAFPHRVEGENLSFPHGEFDFDITLHEYREAHRLGLVADVRIDSIWISTEYTNFAAFVDKFSAEKIAAKKSGDKRAELFAKFILNSSWGKLAANPENYYDYQFLMESENMPSGWEPHEDYGWLRVIRRASPIRHTAYYDVATGASVTGASRAVLMRAIANSKRPIYCDTDSLICESLSESLDDYKLGSWKLEGAGDCAIIISKKLYCVTDNNTLVKNACKGVELNYKDYLQLIETGEYNHSRIAPTFKKDASARFITRRITASLEN